MSAADAFAHHSAPQPVNVKTRIVPVVRGNDVLFAQRETRAESFSKQAYLLTLLIATKESLICWW
jgi:hypothetical protein